MSLSRKPEIGEQVKLHIKPKQRKQESGDKYLLQYEGKTGKIIDGGDQYAPWVYKVDFGGDLPALARLSNLRTLGGESFKPDNRESSEIVTKEHPLASKKPSEKIKQAIREDIQEGSKK